MEIESNLCECWRIVYSYDLYANLIVQFLDSNKSLLNSIRQLWLNVEWDKKRKSFIGSDPLVLITHSVTSNYQHYISMENNWILEWDKIQFNSSDSGNSSSRLTVDDTDMRLLLEYFQLIECFNLKIFKKKTKNTIYTTLQIIIQK